MKPVAWIKIRELSYMKAVAEHGKDDWQTNLGLKPEPDDEGLYTETQVQQMLTTEYKRGYADAMGWKTQNHLEHLPTREWQGLTDMEIKEIIGPWGDQPVKGYTRKLFDQIEAKLKEKNT